MRIVRHTALYTLAVCPPVNDPAAAMTRHDSHPSRGIVAFTWLRELDRITGCSVPHRPVLFAVVMLMLTLASKTPFVLTIKYCSMRKNESNNEAMGAWLMGELAQLKFNGRMSLCGISPTLSRLKAFKAHPRHEHSVQRPCD